MFSPVHVLPDHRSSSSPLPRVIPDPCRASLFCLRLGFRAIFSQSSGSCCTLLAFAFCTLCARHARGEFAFDFRPRSTALVPVEGSLASSSLAIFARPHIAYPPCCSLGPPAPLVLSELYGCGHPGLSRLSALTLSFFAAYFSLMLPSRTPCVPLFPGGVLFHPLSLALHALFRISLPVLCAPPLRALYPTLTVLVCSGPFILILFSSRLPVGELPPSPPDDSFYFCAPIPTILRLFSRWLHAACSGFVLDVFPGSPSCHVRFSSFNFLVCSTFRGSGLSFPHSVAYDLRPGLTHPLLRSVWSQCVALPFFSTPPRLRQSAFLASLRSPDWVSRSRIYSPLYVCGPLPLLLHCILCFSSIPCSLLRGSPCICSWLFF